MSGSPIDASRQLAKIISSAASEFSKQTGASVTPDAQLYILRETAPRADEVLAAGRDKLKTALLEMFSRAASESAGTSYERFAPRFGQESAFEPQGGMVTAEALAAFSWPWPFGTE